MIFDGIDLPFWSEEDQAWVIRETEEWITAVMPMLVNDRIVLGRAEAWGRFFSAGFCFDKSEGAWKAMAAAFAWDPDARRYPDGMKKVAHDARVQPPGFQPDPKQVVCWLCLQDRTSPPIMNPRHCAVCGSVTSEGRIMPYNAATMLFAQGGYLQEVS